MRKVIKLDKAIQPSEKKRRVAAYARVSLDSKQLLHSLSAQVSYYSEYIQKNPMWEYVGVYVDEGITGTSTAKRKEFQRMMADCDAGKIDLILVKSISRLARNSLDLLNTVRHLKEIGVEVRFERENISTFKEEGEFLLTLLASYAQSEAESLSENIKWGKRKGFAQGNVNGMQAGYGYKWQDGKMVIVPEEAEIVKRIYREYLAGKAKTALEAEFNAEGMKTRTGTPWHHTSIRYILSNPIYVGDILLQKTYRPSPFVKSHKWNKGELPQYLLENDHEPIIDRETFAKAQAEQKRRGDLGIFAYGNIPTSCFTQKLECGKCHSVYHRDAGEKRVDGTRPVYWVCYGSYPNRGGKAAICNAGRFLTHEELITRCNEVLGLSEFDERVFLDNVAKVIVDAEKLTFNFIDGRTVEVTIKVKASRKVKKPPTKYSFWTGKIRCTVCGHNYVRQTRHYTDGDIEHYWVCGKGKTCEGRKNGILWSSTIENAVGDVKESVDFISAGENRKLAAHFKDGMVRELAWPKRQRHDKVKGEKKDG